MTEKTTPHVFWVIVTLVCFFIGGPITAAIPVICWVCSAGRTKKHNAKVAASRHQETMRALHNGRGISC
jgi:hypothetical protein